MSTTVYALALFGALAWFGWSWAERLHTQREKAKKDSEEMIRETASQLAEFFDGEIKFIGDGFECGLMRICHRGFSVKLYCGCLGMSELPYSFEELDLLHKIVFEKWKEQENFKRMYEMLITKYKGDTK